MARSRFYALAASAFLLVGAGGFGLRQLLVGIPPIHTLEDYTPSLTTRVHDSKGTVVAELSIEKRALLPLSKIPVDLQNAVIAVEDDAFFKHWGISPKGIIRSSVRNLIARRVVQGASTITQQLAKQIFLKPERKLSRKVREVLLALQIERNFSKPEILQLYLNQVYFGEGAYGAQAAARNYFGKEVGEMTLADCALLAGLIRAPRANSPFFKPENARKRRAVVLSRMLDEKLITKAEAEAAAAQPIPLEKPVGFDSQAPYFVEHVRRKLEQKYGTAAVWRGGMKVYTTLDLEMQKKAEEVMEKALTEFDVKAQAEHEKKLKEYQRLEAAGEPLPVDFSTAPLAKIQGAFVAIDIKTGAVRAMIGGRDSHFNRVTQAKRQPGSTFKPFVWAAALGSGMTAASMVDDTPLAFYFDGRDWRLLEGATDQYSINLATQPFAASPDFKIWVPNNYDGKFMGRVTLRKALANSRNISAINLITQVGPPLVVELAKRAGIRSELEPAPALGLGASVVTPLEMTSAFGTFANGGISVTPYTLERAEDATGKILEGHVPSDKEAMTPQLAYLVTNLMKGVVQAGTGSYARRLNRPLAGKTGTSNDNRDLWFIGMTPDLVAGAWMGYDDFTSLGRKDWTGGSTVVPWWTAIMEEVLKDYPKRDFPAPSGIVFATVDRDQGLLYQPACPKDRKLLEAFAAGTAPTEYCDPNRQAAAVIEVSTAALAPTALPDGGYGISTATLIVPGEAPPPLPTDSELEAFPAPDDDAE
ncbi:MAG: PBP1A family penicillin-binding protein [Elusimicrobiota bacterium]|nr:MAG: PBP1A family penicillin-binding protein [Elusimicrobiota bacterium]